MLVDFIKNIVLTRIPVILIRILTNLIKKFWFIHFQQEIFF